MSKADDFCMSIMAHKSRVREKLGPCPLWYRLPPSTHTTLIQQLIQRGNLPAQEPAVRLNEHGRLWGIPYIVSAEVPEGCVMFTTDYRTWQVLKLEQPS